MGRSGTIQYYVQILNMMTTTFSKAWLNDDSCTQAYILPYPGDSTRR